MGTKKICAFNNKQKTHVTINMVCNHNLYKNVLGTLMAMTTYFQRNFKPVPQ